MKFIAHHAGEDIPVEVERHASGYRVRLGDRWLVADVVNAGPYLRSFRLEDGTQLSLTHDRQGTMHEISLGRFGERDAKMSSRRAVSSKR